MGVKGRNFKSLPDSPTFTFSDVLKTTARGGRSGVSPKRSIPGRVQKSKVTFTTPLRANIDCTTIVVAEGTETAWWPGVNSIQRTTDNGRMSPT